MGILKALHVWQSMVIIVVPVIQTSHNPFGATILIEEELCPYISIEPSASLIVIVLLMLYDVAH